MDKILAYIRIIRPANFLITLFSIIVAGLICSTDKSNYFFPVLLAAFSGALVGGGGNVINDIFDIEIDKINRPERILPSGRLKRQEALVFYLLLNVFAIIIVSFINISSLLIVLFSILTVFLYSYSFKKIPLLGNLIVALMTGLAFIFGGTAVNNFHEALIPAAFAFLINFIRELVKDIEDLDGDMRNQVFSFPARYGLNAALRIVILLSILLFIFTFIPFVFRFYSIEYFMIVMLTVNVGLFLFIRDIRHNTGKHVFSRESFLLKLYMIFGLIAIYFGNYNR